ncbi:MAG TPA: hypothetical protein VGF48_01325 [Thermoanaerobaculia bacterium]|jgi:hypothetical protein
MRKLLILIALAASSAVAQAPDAPRPVFPNNYTPSPCAAENVCETFAQYKFIAAARTFLGFTIHDEWLYKNWDTLVPLMKPGCTKIANCYPINGSFFTFCNDAVVPEMRRVCDRFPEGSYDREQCLMFAETFVLGVDQNSRKKWEAAQKCAKEKTPFQARSKPPIVWTDPATFNLDYEGYITVYALDPDTNLPVPASITVQDTNLFAGGTPLGRPFTYYPFKWPVKLNRVPNANGHRDVVAPIVTVKAEGYPDVTFPMPVEIPKMIIEAQPPLEALKRGKKNVVTFKAHDSKTGQPIEARVMLGEEIIGDTNKPVVVQWKRGQKRPEIWATSLFHRYNDVVLLPGE